jgi:hypothetical protein
MLSVFQVRNANNWNILCVRKLDHQCLKSRRINGMAKRTFVTLTDDLDGSEADRTVRFSLENDFYEIDLTEAHAEDLSAALAPYINAGRRVGGVHARTGRGAGPSPKARAADIQAIRDWARSQGHQVSDRGRISREVRDAFDAAH